ILQGGYGYSHGTIYFKSGNSDAMKINGSLTYIQKIYDLGNTNYYLDLASTGTSLKVAGKIQTCGKIEAEEIEVKNVCAANVNVKMDNLADYVFNEDYILKSLTEVEEFISKNKHLPEVPSASEVKENGMDIAEMNNLLLKKIEELTLYVIKLEKKNKAISERIEELTK
ncbi:MAG: hypothetical protein JW894_06365, partial [Bacteroidales bacterium]|nr:hypothetical protein [Bacteroidales bacterium]